MFRLFLKGGPDIAASLTGDGGRHLAESNLLREWIAAKEGSGTTIEVTQETGYPAAILLQQMEGMGLPEELAGNGLVDPQITGQFQSKLFDQPADVVVLSVLPDITAEIWQRNETGYLLSPPSDWQQKWPVEQRQWFESHFSPLGRSTIGQFQDAVGRLNQSLQDNGGTQMIIYGVSSYDPADKSHNYHSAGETLALRAHRFNHALFQLSQDSAVVVVDVDRLIAETGAQAHVGQVFSYSSEANNDIGRDLVRIIEDFGYFDEHPLLKLVLPQLDQQFQSGSIVKWHVREGKWVNAGDDLYDFRVEEIKRLKRFNTDQPSELQALEINSRNWSWLVRVTAADNGFFRQRIVPEEVSCFVGDLLAVFSVRDNERVRQDEASIAAAPSFRVVTNILETADQDIQQ